MLINRDLEILNTCYRIDTGEATDPWIFAVDELEKNYVRLTAYFIHMLSKKPVTWVANPIVSLRQKWDGTNVFTFGEYVATPNTTGALEIGANGLYDFTPAQDGALHLYSWEEDYRDLQQVNLATSVMSWLGKAATQFLDETNGAMLGRKIDLLPVTDKIELDASEEFTAALQQ